MLLITVKAIFIVTSLWNQDSGINENNKKKTSTFVTKPPAH